MKIGNKIEKLINDQINMELYSANVYLTMAAYCFEMELDGFGNFFKIQMQEERYHAQRYFDFLMDVDGHFELKTIEAPKQKYKTLVDVFKQAQANEEAVTKSTYKLIDAALSEKEFATYTFLEWFIKEQVEEEALMRNILSKLELVGEDKSGVVILDAELGQRKYIEPQYGK